MLIAISDTYRGHVLSRALEPGEHDVPEEVGRYLIETFSGPPFYARAVVKEVIETKPVFPAETKPLLEAEVKPMTRPKPIRKRTTRTKVKS